MIDPIVHPSWVQSQDNVILADVRWYLDGRSGRDEFENGHLPGAIWVDVNRISGPPSDAAGRQPLPTPDDFAEYLGEIGIGDGATVIAYDDDSGAIAARLVWMLRVLGHDAALLDGGLKAWDGELETGGVTRAPVTFTPRPWPADRIATIDDAEHSADVVIDARAAARFAAEPHDHDILDPRAGHIPGSRSLPCRGHVGPDGRLLSHDALQVRFDAVGITAATPVISTCGAGVTACLNLLVMEQLGYRPGRLFPGSWSQYSRDLARPVAIGPD